jgi:hypothetical protein
VKYDGVEIGSISKQHHHVEHRDFWSWGIDTMPVARNFDQAKKLFREAFEKWKDGLPPGQFEENLIHKRTVKGRKG